MMRCLSKIISVSLAAALLLFPNSAKAQLEFDFADGARNIIDNVLAIGEKAQNKREEVSNKVMDQKRGLGAESVTKYKDSVVDAAESKFSSTAEENAEQQKMAKEELEALKEEKEELDRAYEIENATVDSELNAELTKLDNNIKELNDWVASHPEDKERLAPIISEQNAKREEIIKAFEERQNANRQRYEEALADNETKSKTLEDSLPKEREKTTTMFDEDNPVTAQDVYDKNYIDASAGYNGKVIMPVKQSRAQTAADVNIEVFSTTLKIQVPRVPDGEDEQNMEKLAEAVNDQEGEIDSIVMNDAVLKPEHMKAVLDYVNLLVLDLKAKTASDLIHISTYDKDMDRNYNMLDFSVYSYNGKTPVNTDSYDGVKKTFFDLFLAYPGDYPDVIKIYDSKRQEFYKDTLAEIYGIALHMQTVQLVEVKASIDKLTDEVLGGENGSETGDDLNGAWKNSYNIYEQFDKVVQIWEEVTIMKAQYFAAKAMYEGVVPADYIAKSN